ncbi:MAG: DUF2764 family protein [Lachnospiraceae bacterium]|nr:DUF2764 family protein [Lachnospiraceae bacterium]
MASYYYLVASLPELRSDGELPITYEDFLSMCQDSVSKKTYDKLSTMTLDSDDTPLLKKWQESYGRIMEELNYQRAVNLRQTATPPTARDAAVVSFVGNLMHAKNPLEAEKEMLDFEFKTLDELVGLHMFDDWVLFGYAIKLKLLERQQCFVHDKGKKEFRRLMAVVRKRVYGIA